MTSLASSSISLSAVILTGGREGHQQLLQGTGLQSKALLPVGGQPMVLSVLKTLAGSRYTPRIFVSTADPEIMAFQAQVPFELAQPGEKAVQSFMNGLKAVPEEDWVVFISADHPLLTSEMVDYFIDEALRRDLEFSAAIVGRSVVQAQYPASKRSYLTVKGDAYSGGNLYLVRKDRFNGQDNLLERLDQNRKQQWKTMVSCLSWGMVIRFLFRQITIHELVKQAESWLGCRAGVVEMPWAECCMDVDKISDQEMAESIFKQRKADLQASTLAAVPV